MTYDHQREQNPNSSDVVKEDEGFYTASSSSDSEPEKESTIESTLNHDGFDHDDQESIKSLPQESESPYSVYMEAVNEVPEGEKDGPQRMEDMDTRDLREKLGEKEQEEISSPIRRRMFYQKEGLSLIGELESGLSSLNHELGAINSDKGSIAERVQNRTIKRNFSNLERLTKEMDELAKSVDGVSEAEIGSVPEVSRLQGLVDQVNNLKLNVNYLNTQKARSEEEEEEEEKKDQSKIEFSPKKGPKDGKDDSSNQIVAMKGEQDGKFQQETGIKPELDKQIDTQDKGMNQSEEKQEIMQAKIVQLENQLTEKSDEILVIRRRLQLIEKEASTKSSNLLAQISHLQQEWNSEKRKSEEKLTQLEYRNTELITELSDQKKIIKQKEDTIIKLTEESKQVKGRFLQAADRKMDEVAEEFRKEFEDKLRILSQRIRVAEQLQVENKEHWKRTKERCEMKHPALEKKLEYMVKTSKSELYKMSNGVSEMIKGMELVISDFETKERCFMETISQMNDDIQLSKNWVKLLVEELKPPKNDPIPTTSAPMDDKEHEKMMEERVQRLETKVKKGQADKLRLMRGMYDLQNKVVELEKVIIEKDQGLERLSEEKVAAIRQLCLWIDHHQSRFDHLKEMVLVKRKSKGRH